MPRRASETPEEYADKLKQDFQDMITEVDIMTGSFIKARYTKNDISKEDVSRVQEQWHRIRKVLRLRHASEDE